MRQIFTVLWYEICIRVFLWIYGKKEDFCDCSGYDTSIDHPNISIWKACRISCKNRTVENTCYCRNTGFGCGPCACKSVCTDKYQSIKYFWKFSKDDNILLPYSKEATAPFFNNTNKSDIDFIKNIKTSPISECKNTTRKKSPSNEPIPQSKKIEKTEYPFEKNGFGLERMIELDLFIDFQQSQIRLLIYFILKVLVQMIQLPKK